jgi:hypothetical protein
VRGYASESESAATIVLLLGATSAMPDVAPEAGLAAPRRAEIFTAAARNDGSLLYTSRVRISAAW